MTRRIRAGACRRLVATALVVLLPLASAGCFGRFELTRKVYRFNRDISPDKWVRWFTFLVTSIPIYGAGLLIDLVFANSVEFWGGANPFRFAEGPNGEFASATVRAPGIVDVTVIEANGIAHVFTLVREPGAIAAYDSSGDLLGRVGDVDGAPALLSGGLLESSRQLAGSPAPIPELLE
jgi:hypothetical protein